MLFLSLTLIGAALGGSLASFGTLLFYRLPRGVSVVRPRSLCASCATPIPWYDNVPVVSFLMLAGRCRTCRAAIPKFVIISEIVGVLAGAALTFAALRT